MHTTAMMHPHGARVVLFVQHGVPVIQAGQLVGTQPPLSVPDDDPDELPDDVLGVSHEPPMHIAFIMEQSEHSDPFVPHVASDPPRQTPLRSQQPEQELAEHPFASSAFPPLLLPLPVPPLLFEEEPEPSFRGLALSSIPPAAASWLAATSPTLPPHAASPSVPKEQTPRTPIVSVWRLMALMFCPPVSITIAPGRRTRSSLLLRDVRRCSLTARRSSATR
jgi:hypothetical protein